MVRFYCGQMEQFRASRGRKIYLDKQHGAKLQTIWDDIAKVGTSKERTGSPDQKPLALYERIIKGSSNENDLVLDPFCGCATTIIAANNLKRRWIGIDRRVDARYHIITRLMGLTRKDREYVEKYATDREWLDKQMLPYEMHYQTEPALNAQIMVSKLHLNWHKSILPNLKIYSHTPK